MSLTIKKSKQIYSYSKQLKIVLLYLDQSKKKHINVADLPCY